MRRILLILEYHGKDFFGWQRQGPDRTVQAVVETAVADLVGHPVSAQSSGRTDRGVHALAMPAHVDVDSTLAPRELLMAINARLPEDTAVRAIREADPRFHARFDALNKHYRYTLLRSRARSPLLADRTYLAPRALDLDAMHLAASTLVGTHDFASFRTETDRLVSTGAVTRAEISSDTVGPAAIEHGDFTPPPWRKPRPKGSVRTVTRCELIEDRSLLHLDIEGNGFLRGMVRAVAGSLVEVGLGKQSVHWLKSLIDAKDRREAGANLPPQGLTLVRVDYPAEPFEGREGYEPRPA
jgi:tRNA pseudouridine38-40 synthase